jgi:hypothetical protein
MRDDGMPEVLRGRSRLLRAGLAPPVRERKTVLRYALVGGVLAGVAALRAVVRGELAVGSGLAQAISRLHDTVWLPLYGRFWTAVFPDSLIWALMVGGIFTLLTVEYLGLASPIRRAQVALVSWMLLHLPGPLFVGQRLKRRLGLRSRLVEVVLRDLRDDALAGLTPVDSAWQPDRLTRLCHLLTVQIDLEMVTSRDKIAIVETIGVAALLGQRGQDIANIARDAASKLAPDTHPDWNEMLTDYGFALDLAATLSATATLESGTEVAETLAVRTVRIAAGSVLRKDASALVWFHAWARARLSEDADLVATLAEAEGCIAFEDWAAQAEVACRSEPMPELLAETFPTLEPLRGRGELAAAAFGGGG